MSEQLTLELPEDLARRARVLASATHRRVEDAIVEWIGHAVDEPNIASLPNEQLLALCDLTLDATQHEELTSLLEKQREGEIEESERQRLEQLLGTYRRGLLLKAQALKEAVTRGLRPRLDNHAA